MRSVKSGSSLAVLVAALLVLQAIVPVSSMDQQAPRRIIEVNENGLVYIYDILPATGSAIKVGFPREFLKNLVNYACDEARELGLTIEDDFFWITLDGVSAPEIRLLTIFRDIISWNPAARIYSMRIPAYPRVDGLTAAEFFVEIRLPRDSSITEISPGLINQTGPGVLSGVLRNIDLSRGEVSIISLSFSSGSLRLLDVMLARLLVEVPDGRASMSLRVRLLGGSQLSEVRLRIPEGLELIGAEDALGRLSSRIEDGDVVVRLRQPLVEGRSDFFTVIVKVNRSSDKIMLENSRVSISPLMPLNTTVWAYEIEVLLRGGDFRSWSPEPIELRREYPEKAILAYRFDRVDPISVNRLRVNVSYELGVSFLQATPYLALVSLILLISSIIAIYRSREKVAERRIGESFLDEVGLISGIYQRLMGLISSDRIYDRGLARRTLLDIRTEVKQWHENVRRLGEKLAEEEPKIAEQVKELIKAAEGFQHAVERIWGRIYPYLSKSLPRSRLDEALEECRGELKRAHDTVASQLENLRRKLS